MNRLKEMKILQRTIVAVIGSILMAILASSSIFLSTANVISDALYQQPGVPREEIIIIGMDQYAQDEFGVFPWPRDVMAMAIEYLNADPETRPAVIGLDAVFSGPSEYPDADDYFAEVAGQYDNVVAGVSGKFGEKIVTNPDGTFYTDDYVVTEFADLYPELLEVATRGHVNAMMDDDGILRHAIWKMKLQDGTEIPSFHQSIYYKYMEFIGQEPVDPPPTDPRFRWYVPFSSLPESYYDGFSVADLVYQELDPWFFAGKIVLIGPWAEGMQDDYTTAIDRATKMYGVEYQANAIAALLNGNLKTEILQYPQTIAVFFVTLFLLLWFYDRRILPSTIVWLAISIGWVGFCLLMWNFGYVLQVIYMPLSATICYIVSVATNYVRAALEKRRVTNTFQRYVAPQIVSELLKGDPEDLALGGKLTDVAVLFVDIRGFTTMSEALDAPTVVEIVNKYLTLTSECIFKNNGTLDKYVGDCTMAFWGAPLPQDDCIFKAVKAGLDMVEGANALGIELEEKYGRAVNFGVGVHYGPAVIGNIGSPTRMDYTAIGDTVNTSARLESNAPAGQILVSKVVADALEGRVRFTSLGDSIKLKGKSEGFEIFRVEGLV